MGNLLSEIPHSEVTATLELLARHGITRRHLDRLRKLTDSKAALGEIVRLLSVGHRDDPISAVTPPLAEAPLDLMEAGLPWSYRFNASEFERDLVAVKLSALGPRPTGWRPFSIQDVLMYMKRVFHGDQDFLTAHTLDYLLAYRDEIPTSCKGKVILFPGTKYRNRHALNPNPGHPFIRTLVWKGRKISSGYLDIFSAFDPEVHRIATHDFRPR